MSLVCKIVGHKWKVVNKKMKSAFCVRCKKSGWSPKLSALAILLFAGHAQAQTGQAVNVKDPVYPTRVLRVTTGGTINVTCTNCSGSGSSPSGGLTDSEIRATALPVSGSFYQGTQPVSGTFFQVTQPVSGPATDAQIRASDIKITMDGEVVGVTGPLTDAQIRATALPVSGTFFQVTQPVSGPLTDAQLRASDVKITMDGEAVAVTGTFWQATQPVSIAATVAISAVALPLPAGAATGTKQDSLLTELQLKADLTETQPVSIASVPSHNVTNTGTFAVTQATGTNLHTVVDSAPTTAITNANLDVALSTRTKPSDQQHAIVDSGTITTITNSVAVTGPITDTQIRATPLPVSGTVAITAAALPLPSGATLEATQLLQATATKQDTLLTELQLKADLSETQPVSGPLTDAQLRASNVPVSAILSAASAPVVVYANKNPLLPPCNKIRTTYCR